ncbi:imidazole glycerol phosphate synthase subunit HisH [Alphaproteobacteria bacterium]|nr:imidazole glycerol phosphate synthase subunit HisH [Alphaproteobacteria bacterium]
MKIKILDCNLGNVKSIANMLYSIGYDSEIITAPAELQFSDFTILPGVGSFDQAMSNLELGGWIKPLNTYAVNDKKPLLGICLGMQLLTEASDEGKKQGLGFLKGRTVAFDKSRMLKNEKIPHMGWNTVSIKKEKCLFNPKEHDQRFYFVHSYHVELDNSEDTLTTSFNGYEFTSSLLRENIVGLQFHPEKSHKFGFNLLKSVIERFAL